MELPDNWEVDAATATGSYTPPSGSTDTTLDEACLFALLVDSAPIWDAGQYHLTVTTKSATEPTYVASVSCPIANSLGYFDRDGTDDYIYVSTAVALATSPLWVTFRVKWHALNSGEYDTLIYLDDNIRIGSTDGGLGARQLLALFDDGSVTMKQATLDPFVLGVWYNVSVTWNPDGNILKAYLDGVEVAMYETSGFGYTALTDGRVYARRS